MRRLSASRACVRERGSVSIVRLPLFYLPFIAYELALALMAHKLPLPRCCIAFLDYLHASTSNEKPAGWRAVIVPFSAFRMAL